MRPIALLYILSALPIAATAQADNVVSVTLYVEADTVGRHDSFYVVEKRTSIRTSGSYELPEIKIWYKDTADITTNIRRRQDIMNALYYKILELEKEYNLQSAAVDTLKKRRFKYFGNQVPGLSGGGTALFLRNANTRPIPYAALLHRRRRRNRKQHA